MILTKGKQQWIPLAILIVLTLVFWNTIVVYPIKLLVVMFHEMSHGLMAIAFGGEIIEIQIDQNIGGYCKFLIQPGFWGEFMTASAGYLGSLLWGSLILILAVKTERDKYISLALGLILLGLSYFVYQSGELFGLAMTAGLSLFMLVSFKFLGPIFHDLWLKFIGITTCAYVVFDIYDDAIGRSNIGSDADKIGTLIGTSGVLVGILWICIAIITLFFVIRYVYIQQMIAFTKPEVV